MKVFTKLAGKLAVYEVDTDNIDLAVKTVKGTLSTAHRSAVLVLVKA